LAKASPLPNFDQHLRIVDQVSDQNDNPEEWNLTPCKKNKEWPNYGKWNLIT